MTTRRPITLALTLAALGAAEAYASDWPGGSGSAPPGWFQQDLDGDGFESPADCDDLDPLVHPGAQEWCDGLDQDCDGAIDEEAGPSWYADDDGDGFGDPGRMTRACSAPAGHVWLGSDCDDDRAAAFPGATEACNGLDDNCDGTIDEDDPEAGDGCWTDQPGACGPGTTACVSGALVCLADAVPVAETCDGVDEDCDGAIDEDFSVPDTEPQIAALYIGQTHMLQHDDAYFGLVSGREALVKAHITATAAGDEIRRVRLILQRNGARLTADLVGPDLPPPALCGGPGDFEHRVDNAYIGTIPADWVGPGLKVTVRIDRSREGMLAYGAFDRTTVRPRIGAPTALDLNMFDVRYFSRPLESYPAGWQDELAEKLPIARLDVRRIPVDFPELVVPPRPRAGLPGFRVRSEQDYAEQSGQPFDGEQATALSWVSALAAAGGQHRRSVTWINIHGVVAGGQASPFEGVSAVSAGVLIHELGHALSLPHLVAAPDYPYVGELHGVLGTADDGGGQHVGPTWGLDLRADVPGGAPYFIPPIVQPDTPAPAWTVGRWKRSPMQRIGSIGNDHEQGFLYQMFSDWGAHRMRGYIEGHLAEYNPALGAYATWNADDADYTDVVPADGVSLPTVDDVSVISVMVAASGSDPDLDMVYPPIGPYTGGLIQRFDPTVAADRADAGAHFCPDEGCDLTVRVVQGGVTRLYMLAGDWDADLDPGHRDSFVTRAINLPAADGAVTAVELYATPQVEQTGLPGGLPPANALLASWHAP